MRALAVLLTLLIVLGAGGYYATGTPQYSLYLLARGLQDRDETAVGAHFDTQAGAGGAPEARIGETSPGLPPPLGGGARPGIERLLAEALGPLAFPWGLVTTWQR